MSARHADGHTDEDHDQSHGPTTKVLQQALSARDDGDTRVAEIAFHWLESLPIGDATQAVGWTERAGDRAMTQLAWEEAGRDSALLLARTLGPAVALVDVHLPESADGLGLLHALSDLGIPVVAISIHDSIRGSALAAGADQFLEKASAPDSMEPDER